jgi:GlcNAc-P-P-Und epimerase
LSREPRISCAVPAVLARGKDVSSARGVFITGGSGFIGTNLVEHYRREGCAVVNYDLAPPRNRAHLDNWIEGDIRDRSSLRAILAEFAPEAILHCAARTDLEGASLADYSANTQGVNEMIEAAAALTGLRRIVFFSSMLVCKIGYIPRTETDYCATTVYGQSKILGEELVRKVPARELPWVMVRPTSIWGPWFSTPYRSFFEAVRSGWFVLPRNFRTLRSYGYVGNLVAQTAAIAGEAENRSIGQTLYLADYEPLDLHDWANRISAAWGRGRVREVPIAVLRAGALAGDLAKRLGVSRPPLSSFRLDNLLTSAVFDMAKTMQICPNQPVGLDAGIELTIHWLKDQA